MVKQGRKGEKIVEEGNHQNISDTIFKKCLLNSQLNFVDQTWLQKEEMIYLETLSQQNTNYLKLKV